ncbi:hypothetical protein QQS21_003918 [Conoideocrella luteorostrata]|uniref:Carrier domain-containing protein n=1 Tax=Conoideocrella luteorostrata TaxID=1105319 RepID=A0AAJ0G1Y5_9HYPO|nr:hypothetical protein QQS21_003918 [Conoideocrella luteorostrata]
MKSKLRELDLTRTSYGSPYSADPPTLDGLLQGFLPLLGVEIVGLALMPTYVGRLRVSNKIPTGDDNLRLFIVSRPMSNHAKTDTVMISVAAFAQLNNNSLLPIAEWDSVTFRSISSPKASDYAVSQLPVSFSNVLLPVFDLVADADWHKFIAPAPATDDEIHIRKIRDRVALQFMNRTLEETSDMDYSTLPSHFFKFISWAKTCVDREMQGLMQYPLPDLAEVAKSDAACQLTCAIGDHLTRILRREVEPLEIMLQDGLLTRYYEHDTPSARASLNLAKCVRVLSDVNRELRILEVGGGTASATLPVMEALWGDATGLAPFRDYTFTDISSGFFENSRAKLKLWNQRIIYKKLDITQCPADQGFTTGDYDLIIASNVLHATPDMSTTITNVRSLLKPNGKLLLLEATWHPPMTFPFALLPDWWTAIDQYRDHAEGPLLSDDRWHQLLLSQGFSGVDVCIKDYEEPSNHLMSVLCSTKVGRPETIDALCNITICGPYLDQDEQDFAQLVASYVSEATDCPCRIQPFLDLDPEDDKLCIFIDSPSTSLLSSLSQETFGILQQVLLNTKGLLWVILENSNPDSFSVGGIFQSIRLETEPKNLMLFKNAPRSVDGASAIAKLARRLRDPELEVILEHDYVWDQGMLKVPRLRQSVITKEIFGAETGAYVHKKQRIWQDRASFEMTMDRVGAPESHYFRRNEQLNLPLSDDEVLVQADTVGLNSRDLELVLGTIPWTSSPGFEGTGVVLNLGAGVRDLELGDRVYYTLHGGCIATHIRMPAWRVNKVPTGIANTDAASISIAYQVAYLALHNTAYVRPSETVLIHAASGAVGQACIILAQLAGAQIFVTASTEEKRLFLHDTFRIPKTHIFSSRNNSFRDGILNETDGKGVDVVINSLSGSLLQDTWHLMADLGRFVDLNAKDAQANSNLSMRPFGRNVSFSCVDLHAYTEKRSDEAQQIVAKLHRMLEQGRIKPVRPVATMPVSQLSHALRKIQTGEHIGKIVISMDQDEKVLAECHTKLELKQGTLLRPDATYIITGGTGGIGLSLVPWMVEQGAKNIVLLGRSGDSRPEVQRLIRHYIGTDAQIRAIPCNVGSQEQLKRAFGLIQDLPPVKGVIHGALFLRDALFINATYDDWQNIRRPRVQAAWYLDEMLPNLDFFILLSSLLGTCGNVGQAIYAGTSSFYDAFVDYRHSKARPATSIALPIVLDVGFVADRDLTDKLKESLGACLSPAHLRLLLQGAMMGASSGLSFSGKSIAFQPQAGVSTDTSAWQCFNARDIHRLLRTLRNSDSDTNSGSKNHSNSQGTRRSRELGDPHSQDYSDNLLSGLIEKVSSITMMDLDEVEADVPLTKYSLDSLVSVELRNWISRQTGVDLPLAKLVRLANLRTVATIIAEDVKKLA